MELTHEPIAHPRRQDSSQQQQRRYDAAAAEAEAAELALQRAQAAMRAASGEESERAADAGDMMHEAEGQAAEAEEGRVTQPHADSQAPTQAIALTAHTEQWRLEPHAFGQRAMQAMDWSDAAPSQRSPASGVASPPRCSGERDGGAATAAPAAEPATAATAALHEAAEAMAKRIQRSLPPASVQVGCTQPSPSHPASVRRSVQLYRAADKPL
jgi:hypothetical protein